MNVCDICSEEMWDGWTTDCGSVYICSKKCMQDRLVKTAKFTEQRAKEVLEMYYEDDFDIHEDITDEEWEWISGLFWTEWYEEDFD